MHGSQPCVTYSSNRHAQPSPQPTRRRRDEQATDEFQGCDGARPRRFARWRFLCDGARACRARIWRWLRGVGRQAAHASEVRRCAEERAKDRHLHDVPQEVCKGRLHAPARRGGAREEAMTTPPDTPKPPAAPIQVMEGVSGTWFYHLGRKGQTTALCGARVMTTQVPLSAWGHVGHLHERWCAKCADLHVAPSPQESHKLAEELERRSSVLALGTIV